MILCDRVILNVLVGVYMWLQGVICIHHTCVLELQKDNRVPMAVYETVPFALIGSAVSVWTIKVSSTEAFYPPPLRRE